MSENGDAMQAGARRYPAPPFKTQPLKKPGHESALELAPMYDAPYYRGSGNSNVAYRSSLAATAESAAPSRRCSHVNVPMSSSSTSKNTTTPNLQSRL